MSFQRILATIAPLALLLPACGGDGGTGPSSGQPLRDRIVFASDRSGVMQLYAIRPDGTDLRQITNGPERRVTAAVSPDGTRILCLGHADFDDPGLYAMNADGTEETRLMELCWAAAWSPDGSRIALTSRLHGTYDVWIMNADGSGAVNLTPQSGSSSTHHNFVGNWSPDGQRIAFSSNRTGREEIWVMNADGSNPEQFTYGMAPALHPAWSPDGSTIAFTSDDSDILVKAATGDAATWPATPAVNLTNGPGSMDVVPSWSPDGRHIAFLSDRGGDYDVYIMSADGSDLLNLSNSPGSVEVLGYGQAWAR